MRPAAAVPLDQRRRRLAEGAGVDVHRQPLDPAILVELDGQTDPAAAGRRANLGAAVFALEAWGSLSDAASRRISVV